MSELKPCPFCGREAIKNENVKYSPNETLYGCNNDECVCSEMSWATYNQWNTRPVENALCEQLAHADENIHVLMQLIEQKDAEIERLKSEMLFVPVFPQWIPVSEPPKKNGYFWCSIVDDAGCKWADKRLFSVENGWFTIGEQVTHWMPLPQPTEDE